MIARLTIDNLAVERGGRGLFSGLSFAVGAGEAIAVTGANGVGKTSLLRAIAGFIAPRDGRIVFEGAGGEISASDARRGDCHLIGHLDGLKTGRTAREELLFAALWTGGTRASALAAAEGLGLAAALDLEVRKLSAGQRRRLALCRLLASRRSLWLLDEPLAALDGAGRALFGEAMARHLAGGGLIVAAAHEPLPIAAHTVEIGG